MGLLVVYILSVVVGQSISVTLGLLVERLHSPYAGLLVFIGCFFFVFWLSWQNLGSRHRAQGAATAELTAANCRSNGAL